jgi:16S rRNA (adenine1518-N6/adenine1519-N6)-dimethyltransferase
LDRDLVPWLKVKFEHHSGFELFQADALQFDFAQLASERKIRVVGNLPYNISTPLIFHLLQSQHLIHDMHFMLQKEVVHRLAAQVGESSYGRLGIMVQYYCAVENLFEVPPTAFEPTPKVDSAIVRLVPHKDLPFVANNIKSFELLVNTAFQQRRKTLRNALRNFIPETKLENFPLDLSLRAEEVSLSEFVAASNYLEATSI